MKKLFINCFFVLAAAKKNQPWTPPAELEADEVVVKLVDTAPVADVIVVPCTSFDIVGTVAVRSCTVTVSTDIAGAIC